MPETWAVALGPLLEFHHTIRSANGASFGWLKLHDLSRLLAAKHADETWYYEGQTHQGIISVRMFHCKEINETDFCNRAKRAAKHAGFTQSEASQLVAAILEFSSNIVEHSQRIDTGYIAYATQPGRFEFVVADAGIGVLKSLKFNPKFADLQDSGSALELALEEGVSRHSGEPGRGRGFRPVFIGLANISQSIRFRSWDHGCEFERKKDGLIQATTMQKSHISGFFCSVVCDTKTPIC